MRIFILFLMMASAVNAQTPFWVGVWHDADSQCGMIQSDGGAIRLTEDEFFGVESECSMTNPVTLRDIDGMLFDLDCLSEGYQEKSRILLLREYDDRLTIHSDGVTRTYELCEET